MALTPDKALHDLVAGQFVSACDWPDEQRDGLLQAIHQRYGSGVQAILIYGSYLRGKRDTLLDFYVLLDDYAAMKSRWHASLAWVLSPNVYQVCYENTETVARAKYAVMTLGRFEYAMQYDFHSYFWGRFTQPCGLLYVRNDAIRERVVTAIAQAAKNFVLKVVPRMPEQFNCAELVSHGLSLSYQCELRSEPANHAKTLYAHNENYYQTLLIALSAGELNFRASGQPDIYQNNTTAGTRRRARISWGMRRWHGKLLSILRLLKAIVTFEAGFEYLIWKISRHSRLSIQTTPRQRKYPLIFAWPLLWRLYRSGAFR